MLLEPAHDAKMSRTRNRPLVRGLISKRGALLFALVTGALGTAGLYVGVNPTTAFLGALNIALYAGCYTPLKRVHVLNTRSGPVRLPRRRMAGAVVRRGQRGGWLLAALLFAWQFPHFNALSWTIRDEYKYAGYRMLAWTNPARNGRVALRYSLLMFPVCVGLAVAGVTDYGFVVTSAAVNGWMTWQAWRFWRYEGLKGKGLVGESVEEFDGEGWGEDEEWEYEDEVPAVGKEALPA
ncbi:Protoheme IX farnesyltransferase, mitochondrial [Coniosporium tulheliwenetii]|uniref:Protoheme IX farnesyltransferase, mitochondrial n=1 Tax=Coniosporium tulheliwenetii TaxID=3383036 RepID=A0ACC2Z8L4_9PEZI|nr:Protoheme IX farnesyltransferase, mitochondrial [Cladosporium sp. JES 115]